MRVVVKVLLLPLLPLLLLHRGPARGALMLFQEVPRSRDVKNLFFFGGCDIAGFFFSRNSILVPIESEREGTISLFAG